MRFYIHTFGCQMNVNESQKVEALLREEGFEPATSPEGADIILINTCSVRKKPEQKVFSLVGRLKGKGRIIGVMGCVAQQYGERILEKEKAIDFVIGTQNLHRVPEVIGEVLKAGGRRAETGFFSPEVSLEIFKAPLVTPRVSAYVTIMQGCDRFCSYCIVPFVRGRERSRPSAEILREVQALADQGIKEIILLGQNVNRYGLDRDNDLTFPQLLRKIDKIGGVTRVRFVTSHPASLDDKTIRLFGELETICEAIHLPFQSGSNRILKMMGRGYTREMYLDKIYKLRKVQPDIALAADVMVGFPGETEEDFQETLALMETVQFDNLFSFQFTPRPMTRAAEYPNQVPEEEKSRRLQTLQAVQSGITLKKNREQVGKIKEVLVERESKHPKGFMMGRTRDNRVVNFEASPDLVGREVSVRILKGFQNSLLGVMEENHVY
ncbi:MAG: tRNA (N6-isopentenyl adenosine(37)-C2)-methylthiotransferase MiaB [Deltaproteobacteria bacterium]|nr:MAG: tRNA (N6-isopentenyl adenosine(37)-C2)-methylthiotransferase MiaB [Deltaproteobacteria bacterium]